MGLISLKEKRLERMKTMLSIQLHHISGLSYAQLSYMKFSQ
ncbi:hypothetical protein DDD_3323 [Nonlabens dokdonensis DSW-6]|uniref:Uncharacterized protein n=1 Tax=Nonlabens dokdonensis (strain DSM 17205 / KCTC 12402 / DSW-6) TaxID=592029 RepID=L7W9U3_NONDD|nr:hypothetical protein DDD_3323 [Nonlabens dokdonensis DSW-6]